MLCNALVAPFGFATIENQVLSLATWVADGRLTDVQFPGFSFVDFETFIEKNFGINDWQVLESKLFNFISVMSPKTSLLDL